MSEKSVERYAKTVRGGLRFYREQIVPARQADRIAKERGKAKTAR